MYYRSIPLALLLICSMRGIGSSAPCVAKPWYTDVVEKIESYWPSDSPAHVELRRHTLIAHACFLGGMATDRTLSSTEEATLLRIITTIGGLGEQRCDLRHLPGEDLEDLPQISAAANLGGTHPFLSAKDESRDRLLSMINILNATINSESSLRGQHTESAISAMKQEHAIWGIQIYETIAERYGGNHDLIDCIDEYLQRSRQSEISWLGSASSRDPAIRSAMHGLVVYLDDRDILDVGDWYSTWEHLERIGNPDREAQLRRCLRYMSQTLDALNQETDRILESCDPDDHQ